MENVLMAAAFIKRNAHSILQCSGHLLAKIKVEAEVK